jgi:hypothetical protein
MECARLDQVNPQKTSVQIVVLVETQTKLLPNVGLNVTTTTNMFGLLHCDYNS